MSDPLPSSHDLQPAPIQAIHELAPHSYCLRYPRQHDFIPGQVVAISQTQQAPPRLYSICSAPGDNQIEILFNIKSNGELSPWLANRQAGDILYVSAPFGTFRAPPAPACWIAAGTGIAPFRSMLRSGAAMPQQLVQGARLLPHFYFRADFEQAPIPEYVCCCSQEQAPGVYAGRLTQWLRETPTLSPQQHYALCGSAEMVVDVRDILIARGINIDQISSEIYF